MQTQKDITVGQIWEEVDPRLIRKVRVVEVASLERAQRHPNRKRGVWS